ncbi:hypothetical protein DPMN_113654 [Dreissena polymorpha]|uniref:Uncharacterized protein n=1 Tax=Dreissena polymorpha TaxID=45954 RepID=A0A9D4QR09_DREPO|nr:hypothetical protein DPMN_113654 [Dreissena polymorpha]
MMDDDTEIFLQSGMLFAAESNSTMGRDIHFLISSIQLIFKRPRRRPISSVLLRTILHRKS